MARNNIVIMKCDRCGNHEEIHGFAQEKLWGRIHFSQLSGPIWIGSQNYLDNSLDKYRDMCPDCMIAVKNFWEAGKVLPRTGGQSDDK